MRQDVVILGEKNLHNELLNFVIGQKCSCHSIIFNDVETFFASKKVCINTNKVLILIDTHIVSFEHVLSKIVKDSQNSDQIFNIALYNLVSDSGLEPKALSKNVKGFFYRKDSLDLVIKGIKSIYNGEIWISRDILLKCALQGFEEKTSRLMEKNELTKREIEILNLVSMGASNDEISNKIFISTHTVKTHLYNIYKKIKVSSRLQAAVWAADNL